jgi:outer membrane beta-barrel protein
MTNPHFAPSFAPSFAPKRLITLAAGAAALLLTVVPLAAQAQRQSPLADAPAIRKRLELRETRFELGLSATTTVGQDFYHTIFLGPRLAFHINDWLSISANVGYGVANLQSAFNQNLTDSLYTTDPRVPPLTKEPTKAEATASMQKIKAMGAAQLEFTPFAGKFSLFGKIFAHYDFYIFGGGAFLDVEPTTAGAGLAACGDTGTAHSCAVSGFKPGPTAGVGMHAFIKDWIALNFEGRDILARLNPSGRDVNGDMVAGSADIGWRSTYMFALNVVFFLPAASISQ